MRLIVIGGVAAGLSTAARARRLDRNLEITVLEKGDAISYGACGLPYYVEGRVDSLDDLVTYTAEYFRRERKIEVRTRAEVAAIEHARRQVVLADGERLAYDRLVIATGSRTVCEVAGADQPHVFTLHTPDDAYRLRAFLETRRPKRGLVIGAGYIGFEAAEALRTHGVRVTIADHGTPRLAAAVRKHVERMGVAMHLETEVRSVADFESDVVVLAAGQRPEVKLAVQAGVELGRTGAIRVNERMETNLGSVYAAGDCAETTSLITGEPVWLPLGTTANKMGRVAGANAAGGRERLAGIVSTSIVRVLGLGVGMTGLSAEQARAAGFDPACERITARDRAAYFRGRPMTVELVADKRTRRLLGALVMGDNDVAGRVNVVATALAARMKLDEFAQLDLTYAPPYSPVWDPLLIAAQQLLREEG